MQLLKYHKRDGPCENNLVWNITEQLRHNPPTLDKVVYQASITLSGQRQL